MSLRSFPKLSLVLVVPLLATVALPRNASATPREECVEAHGRAQDLRDKNQLARAKQTFMQCAQSSCPTLVQQDCARFSEELAALVPTVSFSARDSTAGDLPATTVYVDDVLVTTRLDDGRSYEIDPGRHVVRYVHDGHEAVLKVVLNQGERGRLLVATFVDRSAPPRRDPSDVSPPREPEARRPLFPLVLAGVGAAAAITGGVLFAVGAGKVPDDCSMATKECASAPGDASLGDAESGVRLANTGLVIGITGAITLAGGLVWYFLQPSGASDSRRARLGGPLFTF